MGVDTLKPANLISGNSYTLTYQWIDAASCVHSASQSFSIYGLSTDFPSNEITLNSVNGSVSTPFSFINPQNLQPYQPLWNSLPIYKSCNNSSNNTYSIAFNTSIPTFNSYHIDWGDNQMSSGSYGSSPTHIYTNTGLYLVTITLYYPNGCSTSGSFYIYFGVMPNVGGNTPGGAFCISPGQNSAPVDYRITDWENDPIGLPYYFEFNDGTKDTAYSPLVNPLTGITTNPNLVYINDTLYYRRIFTSGSCGLIISPATKARISYYYINTKGESTAVANYTNENTASVNETIEQLNKRIVIPIKTFTTSPIHFLLLNI